MNDTQQKQLGSTLWAIADKLRGAMNADDFRDYRILNGCNTKNFTADTWQSFVDIFPDNSSSGITKRVSVGINIAHIPETYANLLTSKGYTLYAARS